MDYYGLLFLYYLKGLSGKSILRLFFNIEVGGTEQLLPENTSTPTTTPILADIQYPDGLRTDQYFTYRETPTTISNKARIKTIKGNTIVWNQLVQNGNFADTSKWLETRGTISASSNVLSYTISEVGSSIMNRIQNNNAPLTQNHKYLMAFDIKPLYTNNIYALSVTNTYGVNTIATLTPSLANTWNRMSCIFTNSLSFALGVGVAFECSTNYALNDVIQIRNYVLFDLTLMFGSGNEPSTVEEFTSLFPLSYYSYNQGSLLSFNGNGIKTTGKNLLPYPYLFETVTRTGITMAVNTDGSIKAIGTNTSSVVQRFDLANITLEKGSYIFTGFAPQNGAYSTLRDGDSDSWIMNIGTNNPLTVSKKTNYRITLNIVGNASIDTTYYPLIRFADADSSYEPYTSSTLSLPVSTYFPTGMKSAGSVYDELTPTKAITRIGTLNFDDFTWQYDSQHSMWVSTTGISDGTSTALLNANIPFNKIGFDGSDLGSRINGAYNIWVRNGSSSVEPSGEAYYELATPTETPITTEDANEALSLLMGKSVSSNNANQLINIITKGE